MRRAYKHLVLVALVSMFVGLGMTASHAESSLAQTLPPPDPQPNIIFILTDDMRYDDLEYMTETSHLADQGMSFQNTFVSNPLCCPSRATIMRGQYAHNSDVWFNTNTFDPDRNVRDGGWQGYNGNGYEDDNVATRLHDAGYTTGFFGKYLNGYDGTTVPRNWDKWFALKQANYYNYDIVNTDGTTKHYGTKASDYSTDVLRGAAKQFIADKAGPGKPPVFAYIAPKAPHGPAATVPRHQHDFDGEKAPSLSFPSFNERDVSDKPPWIQSLRRLTSDDIAAINRRHEQRVESLQSVDDLVKDVVDALSGTTELSNTYIVFTSDNGWYHGEHRIRQGKARPYEEAPHVPLVIYGPRAKAGSTTDKLVLNTDYFPTFLELARVQAVQWPPYLDGRSLLPVLDDPKTTSWTRTAILIEGRKYSADPEIPVDRNYNGIRTSTSKYIEYEGGFREFYDLDPAVNQDNPYEVTNIYYSMNPSEPPISEGKPSGLDSRLDALKSCQPEDDPTTTDVVEIPCQTAED
jgi:N-acetylglucosamine-6-sulfatase